MSTYGQPVDVEALRYAMRVHGLSQVDFAKVAGISQPTVSAALAGKLIAPKSFAKIKDTLYKLARDPRTQIGEQLLGEQVPA